MAKHLNDVSPKALERAARKAVAEALASEFPADPLIGPELSRAISTIASVVKRHGPTIEQAIAGALVASDRFEVRTNVDLPLVTGARQLLDARNSDQALANIRLSVDSEADSIVNVDLVVVDPDRGWAGGYQIKRGNGATEHWKRRRIMRDLQSSRLVLASYLRKEGYGTIEDVSARVIDYYGASGFPSDIALTRNQLDEHFGVPVVATVETMTAAMSDELDQALPRLLWPLFESMTDPGNGSPAPNEAVSKTARTVNAGAEITASGPHKLTGGRVGCRSRQARSWRTSRSAYIETPRSTH